jgi:hypothetical protein
MSIFEEDNGFNYEDDVIRRSFDEAIPIERQPSFRIALKTACALGLSDLALRFCGFMFTYSKGIDTSWAKDIAFYGVSALSGAVGISMAGTSAESIRELAYAVSINRFIDGYEDILEDPGLR